jgi:hypothetical protein
MIKKTLITSITKLEYHIPKSSINKKPNILKELHRKDIINKLTSKYNINIKELMIMGYSKNYNKTDQVLCTGFTKCDIANTKIRTNLNRDLNDNISQLNKKKYKNVNVSIQTHNTHVVLSYNNINYRIDTETYNRILSQQIIKTNYNINNILWCLYFRYNLLDFFSGMQGSCSPQYYKHLHKTYDFEVECFGSFINHTYKYYFGLFYDLEKYFGCLGNYFNCNLIKGSYVVNPPFIVQFINNTINHIVSLLNKNAITFFIILPLWSIHERQLLNNINKCKNKYKTDYDNDVEYDKLKNNKYMYKYLLYCKEQFPYYNYITSRLINYTATNVIILNSNKIKHVDINFLPKYSASFANNRYIMN